MRVILATDGSQFAEEADWLLAHLPHSNKLELTVCRDVNWLTVVVATAVTHERPFAKQTTTKTKAIIN